MVNNDPNFPPLEGPITSNPDDGVPFTVTIPFIGVRGPATTATSDGARLRALPNGTADLDDPDVAHEPRVQGVRELLVGRSPHGRQRPEAGHHRPGRLDRLDRQRHRQQGRDDLRHLDGLSARGRRRSADAPGASHVVGRGHQGGDREHGRSGAGHQLPHESRWHRARPAAEVDHDAGRGSGERRRVRGLGQLRVRGAAGQLLEDARDHAQEQRRHRSHVRRRAGERDHEHGAHGRAERVVGDRPRRWDGHGQRDAERRRVGGRVVGARASPSARSAA